jgi:hypothetical protein
LSKVQYFLIFSVGEDGVMVFFGALSVAGCGPMVVIAPTS